MTTDERTLDLFNLKNKYDTFSVGYRLYARLLEIGFVDKAKDAGIVVKPDVYLHNEPPDGEFVYAFRNGLWMCTFHLKGLLEKKAGIASHERPQTAG